MKNLIDDIIQDLTIAVIKDNTPQSDYMNKVFKKLKELKDSIPTPAPIKNNESIQMRNNNKY